MRLLGAIFRALVVVAIVTIPSLLLTDAPAGAVEFSLIIGAIIGIFTVFEYGSGSPGFVDFRFAPPYNRFRVFTITLQIVFLSLVCRAMALDVQSASILNLAQNIAEQLDFPYSPVAHAINVILETTPFSSASTILLVYTISISFAVGIGLTGIFAILLWVFNWPTNRATFNLWVNLPMFQPSEGKYVVKRLRRDATINIVVAIILIYLLPYVPKLGFDWFKVDLFETDQSIVWTTTLWIFVPSGMIARAFAMQKIARIIGRAQRR